MTEVATLGLKVDGTANIDNATQSLGRFTKSGQDAEKSTDSLSKGSQKSSKSLADVARESDNASKGMASLASAARSAGALIAASLGGLSFGRVIKETAGFEQSLLGLQVVSGATAKQMKELERQSRTLGATSMFSAQQAADAQNYLAMAGFNVNEVLSATPGLLELAAAGSMDLASAADLASNVLGGFRLEVDQLGRVNDVLAAAAAGSNTSIQQLGQAMSYAAPIAAAAGVSIEQTAAAIGVLSDAGLQGSRAGTGLLGVIRQLSNLTPNATSALNAYGLTAADVNVEQRGLNEVLQALSEANIDAADSFKIFGSEAGPAAQILASGAVRVNEFTGELELAEGAARRAALILGSGLQGSFKSLTSAIGESTLQLGRDSGLSAGLQEVIDYATGVISVYNGMLDVFQDANDLSDDQTRSLNNTATALALAAGATGGLTAAYAGLTTAIWLANAAMTAFMRLLRVNPIVLAASALASLGGAFYTARNRMIEFGDTQATISDWLRGAWEVNRDIITRTTGDAADAAISAFESISDPVGAVFTYLWETFSALMGNIGRIAQVTINSVIGYWHSIVDVVAVVARTMQTMFRDAFSNILGVAGGFWESIQAVFTGDLSFGAFRTAVSNLQQGFTSALSEAADEIQSSVADNLSRDYLGEAFSEVSDGIGFVIDDFKDLGEQISEAAFIARMSRNGFGEVAEGFSEGKTEAELLQDQLDKLNDRTLETASSTDKLTKAQRDAQKALQDSLSTYSALFKQISPAGAALDEYNATVASLTVAYEDGAKSALEYYAAIGQAAKNYNDAVRAADPNIKRVEELTRQYDAAYLKGQDLRKAVDDLTAAYRRGDIDGQQYGRMIQGVRDEMAELALEADPLAKEMARSWEEAAKRIDETFADAFVGAFDSFSDFADQLMSGFKRLLGELAYQATLKPIVVQMTGQMQGMMGGGQGGGSLDLSPGGLSNAWNMVQNGFGGIQWTGASNTAYAGTGWANAATQGTGATGFLGGSASNFSGATGLASLGAGFAGSYAGTELGSSVFGREANSNYGSMAGGAIGTYLGGPVGAFLGSTLGGLADSLFGSGKKTYDFDFLQGQHSYVFGDRTSAFGDSGLTALSDYKLGEQQDALQELLTSVAEFDNVLAGAAIPERVDAMRKSIEGFTHSGPEDLFETRLREIINGSGAYVEEAVAAIADPEKLADAFVAVLNLERIATSLNEQIQRDVIDHLEANTGDIQGTAGSLLQAIDATILLGNSVDRLNLQFDATAEGAIHSAFAIQDAVGGLENLASIQQGYYQAAFSETERLSHAQEDLAASLMGVTENIPHTIEDLRALVEAQDLNTDAGGRLAYELMALAPALKDTSVAVMNALEQQYQDVLGRTPDDEGLNYWFEQVSSGAVTLSRAFEYIADSAEAAEYAASGAAGSIEDMSSVLREREQLERQLLQLQGNTAEIRRRELQDTHESNRALRERIWAFQDEQERLQELERQQRERIRSIEQEASAMARAREQWASFGNSIQSWIDGLNASNGGLGTPQDQLDASDAAFWAQYEKALTGDREAMNSITQYADRYAENLRDMYASGTGAQAGINEIKDALSQLPELISPESFLADEFRKTIDNQTGELIDSDKDLAAAIAAIIKPQGANIETAPGDSDSIIGTPGAAQDYIEKDRAGADAVDNSTAQKINTAYHDVLGRGAQGAQFSSWADWLDQKAARAGQLHQAVAWANLPVGGREWLEERGLYGDGTVPQFANGGYTGSGGKYDPAGIVHAGEIVWSQSDIARAGGVAAVESMRNGFSRAPDISSFPLLNNNDVTQVIGDLRRTIEAQGKQITELLTRVDKNTRDGANATASGAAEARSQRDAMLRENEAQSRLLRIEKEGTV